MTAPDARGAETGRGARRWRKKPVVVDAIQYTGQNWLDVWDWYQRLRYAGTSVHKGSFHEGDKAIVRISTLEGIMEASAGDWIICGVKGELYPCKPDIFEATYEPEQS